MKSVEFGSAWCSNIRYSCSFLQFKLQKCDVQTHKGDNIKLQSRHSLFI
ncbi:unnamed protein product [Brassica oleracea]